MRYSFKPIDACNMCGNESARNLILGKRLNKSQGKNPRARVGLTTTVMRCTRCDLVYSNPLPIPANLQDHYGVPPESYWKPEYFKVDPLYFDSEIKRLRELMPVSAGLKSLDIGAGIGKSMIAFSRAGFDAFGIEGSESFYQKAISDMGISTSRLQRATLEEAAFDIGSFDFISFGAVLEHLFDPSASIIKALSWLKRGGIMRIEAPSSHWLISKLANLYYRMIGTDYVANISPMHSPYHLYEFGVKTFEMHSQRSGYDIAAFDYYVCDTYMPSYLNFLLVPLMERTDTGMTLVLWARKR